MSLQQLCDRAVKLHQLGKFDAAEQLFLEVLLMKPASDTACRFLADIRLRQGRTDEAEQLIETALKIDPNKIELLISKGLLMYKARRFEEALACIDKVLAIKPGSVEVLNNRGIVLTDLRRYGDALASYDAALKIRPGFTTALVNRGRLLGAMGREAEALASFDKALEIEPDQTEARYNRGAILLNSGRFSEALESFGRIVLSRPEFSEAWNNHGTALRNLGRFEEAFASYSKAVAHKPDYSEAWFNRGFVLRKLMRFKEAASCFEKVLVLKSGDIATLYNSCVSLWDMECFENSLACFDRLIALKPDYADAYSFRGLVLLDLKRPEEALSSAEHALQLNPNLTDGWNNRGIILQELKRFDEALASYEKALAQKPDSPEILVNYGTLLRILRRPDAALANYDRALALRPTYAEAWNNRGNIMRILNRFEDALTSYDRALVLKPDYTEALAHRGSLQWAQYSNYEQAVADLERVVLVDPDYEFARGDLFHLKMHGADWSDLPRESAMLDAGVQAGKLVVRPFVYQSISNSPENLSLCANIQASHFYPAAPAVWNGEKRRHAKIRIGYLSGEFRAQATAYLMTGLYECHDKEKFELLAFDNGRGDESKTRKRIEGAFDKWADISKMSDLAAAKLIHSEEIDILVNLNGYFGEFRMGVFAHRPAPIQVNYLGFPGTLGANYIDYIISDRIVIPPDERSYYVEKVVWLPDSYQVNDGRRAVSPINPDRVQYGLPTDAFIFCNFNQGYKLTPALFDVWARILNHIDGSALWLLEGNRIFRENMRREAERRGVGAERLIFAPTIETEAHLARMTCADLFVDSLPCNAHTTASDALWMGLPLLTCRGHAFSGRVAASLLHAIGLTELVTENLEDYEALAIRLAREPAILQSLRERLTRNRRSSPLFDTARFARHIESAYTTMWNIATRGEAPRSFAVEPISN